MTPEALAALHARCFDAAPRPWRAAEFASLIVEPSTLLVTDGAAGFALGRLAGPEAELLTLAVAPERRRQGIARRLLARLEVLAGARGAEVLFLEVASTNVPAQHLYAAQGYLPAGIRRDYYGPGTDALVLRKSLDRPATGHGKTI